MAELILKPGKERSAMRRHPWIFEGSVERLNGRARPGDTVDVFAHDGRPLGRAAWSPHSQIRARLWTFDADETIDHAFFKRRVAAAVAARAALPELRGQQGLRLIHGESDGLPGVIADRYGDTVVLQLNSAGAEKWRDAIVAALLQATGCTRVFERSDSDVRGLEGLEPRTGFLHGEASTGGVVIEEHGLRLEVDIRGGHKTGFYLDQRENRRLVRELVRRPQRAQLLLLHRRLQPAGAGRRRGAGAVDRQFRPGAGIGAAQPGAESAACRRTAPSGATPTSSRSCAR